MGIVRENVGTVEDLHASATKITGLTDFGDDDYLEGLGILLQAYHSEADLTPAGRKVTRAFLRGALVARALSEAAWRNHPEHAQVPLTRPILVTGLPRTGTTALHRLLTADPDHQGLELWLAEVPQPRPPRNTWDDNPIYAAIADAHRRHHIEQPEFMGLHYTSADQVEECWQLLRQSLTSVSYECLARIPSYSEWLASCDWRAAYRRHRRNLQLIGLPDAHRRWVLKNPSHLFALDALLEVYPDALIVQTHRDPRTAIASVCSLNAHASEGWSSSFTPAEIGRTQLDLWARGLSGFLDRRAAYDPAQFVDVQYEAFVADPIGTVEHIYARLGTWPSLAARSAMTSMLRSGEGRPAHRYTLEDFGLSPASVEARFEFYRDFLSA